MFKHYYKKKIQEYQFFLLFSKKRKTILFWKIMNFWFYADSFEAVFTYKISKKEVGIIINKAVAVNPKILTSIKSFFEIFCACFSKKAKSFKENLKIFKKQYFSECGFCFFQQFHKKKMKKQFFHEGKEKFFFHFFSQLKKTQKRLFHNRLLGGRWMKANESFSLLALSFWWAKFTVRQKESEKKRKNHFECFPFWKKKILKNQFFWTFLDFFLKILWNFFWCLKPSKFFEKTFFIPLRNPKKALQSKKMKRIFFQSFLNIENFEKRNLKNMEKHFSDFFFQTKLQMN